MFACLENHPRRAGLTGTVMILAVSTFVVLFGNLSFFTQVLKTYPFDTGNAVALLSLPLVLVAVTTLLLGCLCIGRATKPVLIACLVLSSLAAYFMDSYGVVIDREMLENAVQTNLAEARDLFSLRLLAYLGLLGLLPAVVVARIPLRRRGWRAELSARLMLLALALAAVIGPGLALGGFYTSFVREHKSLRSFVNPAYYVYSLVRFADSRFTRQDQRPVAAIGTDAQIPASDTHRELVILVVGETARADRFALNGYPRDTNPRLRPTGAISFTNFQACGTSTAVSVPCMFSLLGSEGVGDSRAANQENLLDVLQHAGTNVIWLDNNSDSKGVAARVPYESFRSPETNRICDEECRDEGMLARVHDYVAAHPRGDIFIVLHQMGNHGPAYYKRYPAAFERFTPTCRSNDLSRCSREEIDNAYDNAILYTDHFLAQVIELLKGYDAKFETAMFYLSDHGESLGESGIYLHGMPRTIAPESQLHVPAILWFGAAYDDIDVAALARDRTRRFSHDNLFHTVLGLFEIRTGIYRADLDIAQPHRRPGS